MNEKQLSIHLHNWSVTVKGFHEYGLDKFMKLISSNTFVNSTSSIPFIDAMEAYNYPIFATMYHPEAKLYPVSNPATRDITDEIAYRFSLLLN